MNKRIRKLHPATPGKSTCELDKFKAVWRDSMPEDIKQTWRQMLNSRTPHKAVCAKLLTDYGANVEPGMYITRLRRWVKAQDKLEAQREKLKEYRLQAEKKLGPNATLEQLRVETLKCSYENTLNEGDFQQGLATVREDVRAGKLALDTRKVVLLEIIESKAEKKEKKPQLTPRQRAERIKQIYGNI
jgi:hypothetical protein